MPWNSLFPNWWSYWLQTFQKPKREIQNLTLIKTQILKYTLKHLHSFLMLILLPWFFFQCGIWLRLMTHVTFLFYFDACCLCYTQTPQLLWFPQPENIVLALKVNCMPTVCLKSALSAYPWCRSVVVFRLIVLSVSRLSYLIFPLSDVKVIYNGLKDHDPWKLINKWPEPVV